MTTPNPKRRMSGGTMKSDAMIRREKLQQIQETGTTDGIHRSSLARFEEKGYLSNGKLTKRGLAVMNGKIGAVGRGSVDFGEANYRAGKAGGMNSQRGHDARAAALRGSNTPKETAAEKRARIAWETEQEKEYQQTRTTEEKQYRRIIPGYALKISLSDGNAITREHVDDLTGEGWQVLPAATVAGKVGRTLPGAEIMAFNPEPLGATGKAHAVVIWGHDRLNRATVEAFRSAGWDVSSAPKRYREEPAPVKNPSPGERKHGPHASAEERKAAALALKKARAFFDNDNLVTEPQRLKAYKPPQAYVDIGDFIAIEYDSHKFDGKQRIYRHESQSKKRCLLSVDGSTMIFDPPLKLTKRGIEG